MMWLKLNRHATIISGVTRRIMKIGISVSGLESYFRAKIIWILLGGLLVLLANQGQALVSPQHYERMKMENQQKARGTEKVQPRVLVKNQVHQPNPVQPQGGSADSKQSPGR